VSTIREKGTLHISTQALEWMWYEQIGSTFLPKSQRPTILILIQHHQLFKFQPLEILQKRGPFTSIRNLCTQESWKCIEQEVKEGCVTRQ
jgi:hypothetical protein